MEGTLATVALHRWECVLIEKTFEPVPLTVCFPGLNRVRGLYHFVHPPSRAGRPSARAIASKLSAGASPMARASGSCASAAAR